MAAVQDRTPPVAAARITNLNPRQIFAFPIESAAESGGLVLARPDVDGLFVLNESARLVWEEFSAGASLGQICRRLADEYRISPGIARRDVRAILTEWHKGLLADSGEVQLRHSAPPAPDRAKCLDCLLNGTKFRVLAGPGEFEDEIVPRLEHLRENFPGPDYTFIVVQTSEGFEVARDGIWLGKEQFASGARVLLLQEMTRLCQANRRARAMLHAGACGTHAACVLLAGSGYAGKSTLCAALMDAGMFCYSDDSVVLGDGFRVYGMPFPLMLREGSWQHFPHTSVLPAMDRSGAAVRFLPSNLPHRSSPEADPQALVFVEYGADETRLVPMTTLDALLELKQSGFWVERQPETIGKFIEWLLRLPKYRLSYSRLSDAVSAVKGLL